MALIPEDWKKIYETLSGVLHGGTLWTNPINTTSLEQQHANRSFFFLLKGTQSQKTSYLVWLS